MNRILGRLTAAAALGLLAASLTVPVAAAGKPGPVRPYATISVDSKCNVTLVTAWSDPRVGYIYAFTYVDGAYVWTQDAPGTGPNAGTFDPVAMTATWLAGPLVRSKATHTFSALVTFNVSNGGENLGQITSNTVSARCALPA